MIMVGHQGKFSFKEPVGNLVEANKQYKVVSVRAIKELIDYRQTPYETIYKPYNIPEDTYREHVEQNVNIITLTNHLGISYLYVPEPFIIGAPDTAEYEYTDTLLAINLGNMYKNIDLEILKDELKDVIMAILGLSVEIKKVETSAVTLVDKEEHEMRMRLINYGGSRKESYRLKYALLQENFQKLYEFSEGIKKGIKVDISVSP